VRLPGVVTAVLPRFAALTQVAKVPVGMAIRFDASLSVRPCARTSFTASSRNSGVYVLSFVICAPFGEVYQKGVSEKVRLPQFHQCHTTPGGDFFIGKSKLKSHDFALTEIATTYFKEKSP
jgi:hypothetical protein